MSDELKPWACSSLVTRHSSLLFLPFVKRHLDYLRANCAATHVYLNLLTFICKFYRNICHADILLQVGRGAARCDAAQAFAVNQDLLVVARNSALRHLEADKPSLDTLLLL